MNNKEYLNSFENRIIIPGLEKKMFCKEGMVTLKNGKLANTAFGKFIGNLLECEEILAVDYYGHIKKSKGLLDMVEKYKGIEIKSVLVPVVYWASIKNEDIAMLAPDLLDNFPLFKSFLIDLRGFKTIT